MVEGLAVNPDEWIKALEQAFDGVVRSSTSLHQFLLTDQFGMSRCITNKEWTQAGKSRLDFKWQDIPDSEIEECGCLLAHMQAEEFQYFLPAYMRYSVQHYQKSILETDLIGSVVFSLNPSCNSKHDALYAYSVRQLSLLNEAQNSVVVQFLYFVATSADYAQRPDAVKALERYWKKASPQTFDLKIISSIILP